MHLCRSSIWGVFLAVAFCLGGLACSHHAAPTQGGVVGNAQPAPNVVPKRKDPLFFIQGQLCQHLRKIFQDSKGNLWFGTNVYDLMRYDGDSLVYLTRNEGFSGGRVTGIAEDQAGNIWFASGIGLNRFDGQSFTVFDEEDGLRHPEIWGMDIDPEGTVWIGHKVGFCRFDGARFTEIPLSKPQVNDLQYVFYPDRVARLVVGRNHDIWLGLDGYGIAQYDGEGFAFYSTAEGLPDVSICSLMMDSKGYLWIGTFHGGLSRFDGEHFTNYTQAGVISGEEISALYEDKNGDIWIGVENNGVYRYDGETFHHFAHETLHGGSILCFYRDREDRFWLGGWGGLFRMMDGAFVPVTKEGPWK